MPQSKGQQNTFTEQQLAKFRASISQNEQCWIWTGPIIRNRTIFHYGASGHMRAPRASWIIASGGIADGFDVHVVCGTANCVRPEHLRICVTGSYPFSRQERFESFVSKSPDSDCFLFNGHLDQNGYGKF